MTEKRLDIYLKLALCVVTVVAFLPSLGGAFTNWDDSMNVTDNLFLRGGLRDGLVPLLTQSYLKLFIPTTYAVFWLEFHVWGLTPWAYHLVNLICHLASVLLAYGILRAMLPSRWPALLTAAWWAVHPLNVEPVAWITGLKDVLCLTLTLASWRLYIAYRQSGSTGGPARAAMLLAASVLAFLLACLSKPIAVTFPLVLVAYDLFFGPRRLKALWPVVLFLAAGAAVAMQTLRVQRAEEVKVITGLSLDERVRVAADSALFYVGKAFWPAGLCPVYGRTVADALATPGSWIRLALGVAIVALAVFMGRRWWMAGVIFVAGLAPVSGIVPFAYQMYSTVADRYAYLPLLGAALALGDLLARPVFGLRQRLSGKGALAAGAMTAWIIVLGALTWQGTDVWRDSLTVWERVWTCNPNPSPQAWVNYGGALFDRGRVDEALPLFQRSIELDPTYAAGHYNVGRALLQKGQRDAAKAEYLQALKLNPTDVTAWTALGALEGMQGNYAASAKALAHALVLEPRNQMAAFNLGLVLYETNRPSEAADALKRAVALAPEDYQAHYYLGLALEKMGAAAQAREEFLKVAAAPRGRIDEASRAQAAAKARALTPPGTE